MQTRFLLVRHGTCAHIEEVLLGRTLDVPLDDNGRQQAHAVAAALSLESPLRVESSPRRRATETAWAIATASGCGVRIAAALDELDFGTWSGKPFAELERDRGWRRWNRDREHARTPAGVDIPTLQASLGRYLASLAESCAGATLVLVTHAEIIRSIILQCIGARAGDYQRIAVEPASVTRICMDADGMRMEDAGEQAPRIQARCAAIATEAVP